MRDFIVRVPSEFMFQLIISELMFLSCCQKKKGSFWKASLFAIIMILGYDLITVLVPLPDNQIIISISICFAFVSTLVGFWWCYGCKINDILFCGVVAYAVQNLGYNIQIGLEYSLGFEPNTLAAAVSTICSISSVYFISYFLFAQKIKKYKIEEISRLRNLVNSIFILLLTSFFPILFSGSWKNESILFLLYAWMGDILVLFIQFDLLNEGRLQRQNEMMEQILRAGQRQYQISKENIELVNMKCHDLKHQIKALRTMKDEEMKEEAIAEIEQAIQVYDSSIKTGNDTLDVLLMEKSLYAEKNSIKLTCIADGTKLDFMKPYDVYSLFGNILDNAIESVCKEVDMERRIISLNVTGKGKLVKLHFENYFNGTLTFENGLPKTTKEDTNTHGYGMMSARHIIKKYEGNMVVGQEDSLFVVNILIPIP